MRERRGGMWVVPGVNEEPVVTLSRWTVRELSSTGTRHFVGYNMVENEGRVSSAIVDYDTETKMGTTSSGRVYELYGQPGYNGDAEYVWERWSKGAEYKDVTDEYYSP